MPEPNPTVDVVLSVFNGALFVEAQIRSLQEQTHVGWRLWVRDDGSTDDSYEVVAALARDDDRIRLHPRDGENLGAAPCYGFLLERLPGDARHVFLCDADDVWLPRKIERTLELLLETEARTAGPALVHSDMRLVDEDLRPLADSFWTFHGVRPEPVTLRRLTVTNVATGPTMALSRSLADLALPIPGVPHHDWWIAMVASAFGTVAALPETTVLYRRHASNVTGLGRGSGAAATLRGLTGAFSRSDEVRRWTDRIARQASSFVERYGDRLDPDDRARLERVAGIGDCGTLERKRRLLDAFRHAERGWLHTLGWVARG